MTGIINLLPMNFISVSNVDGNTSNQIRVTAVPNSYDIIPVRNQILELDLVNTNKSQISINFGAPLFNGYEIIKYNLYYDDNLNGIYTKKSLENLSSVSSLNFKIFDF